MKIDVVIGANFGDEGKGLVTDYLATSDNGVVVRFNGGAQAGHTVVTPEGIRHVFHHFGSATLRGYATYLPKTFIVNPILFIKEFDDIRHLGIVPKVAVHPGAIVTTPFDMMLNQIVEKLRGNTRHGSCGVGIFETVTRNSDFPHTKDNPSFKLSYKNLIDKLNDNTLRDFLVEMRKIYVPRSIYGHGYTEIPVEFYQSLMDDSIIDNFIEDVNDMSMLVDVYASYSYLEDFDHIILEGAQGLLLDKDNRDFYPNLTPSKTGIWNCVKYLKMFGENAESVNINYVTRTYMTRHGAGKFPSEVLEKPYKGIVDMTNVSNDFQGSIRYGILNTSMLVSAIAEDTRVLVSKIPSGYTTMNKNIFVTCLDQIGKDEITFIKNGASCKTTIEDFLVWNFKDFNNVYTSWGMTRDTIEHFCYCNVK